MGRLARLAPPPRLVDWSLFALVGLAAATGITSFWVGHPSDAALFWIHAVAGLSLPLLLMLKFRRVAGRVRDRRAWDRATPLSLTLAAVAVTAAATGVGWAIGVTVPLGFWTLLNLHILFGLLLVPLLVVHLRARYRPLPRTDLRERRVAVQYAGLVAAAGVTSAGLRWLATLLGTPASTRRFTGSRALDDDADLPVTSWVADDPEPVDPATWTLSVRGLVDRPLELGVDDLDSTAEQRALLDCTSGWYAERDWQGVQLGDVLDAAGAADDAAWATVRSVTGYRWSLPRDEANGVMLATHLSGERLDHGHGYPLRLVAPGRSREQSSREHTRTRRVLGTPRFPVGEVGRNGGSQASARPAAVGRHLRQRVSLSRRFGSPARPRKAPPPGRTPERSGRGWHGPRPLARGRER